jgi:hypothetical protein
MRSSLCGTETAAGVPHGKKKVQGMLLSILSLRFRFVSTSFVLIPHTHASFTYLTLCYCFVFVLFLQS